MTWSDSDMFAFMTAVRATGVAVNDALLVYTSESNLNPQAGNSVAIGIAQWTYQTLKGLGWTGTFKGFGGLTVGEQAPWVGRLIAAQVRYIGYVPKSALELYVANFSPVAAKARATKIYSAGTIEYNQNSGLDRDKKGWIAPSDLQVSLVRAAATKTYADAIAQAARIEAAGGIPKPSAPVSPSPSSPLPEPSSTEPFLKRGAKGPHVEYWQWVVGSDPDGIFGPNTEQATRVWQLLRHLPGTGIVDHETWCAAFPVKK